MAAHVNAASHNADKPGGGMERMAAGSRGERRAAPARRGEWGDPFTGLHSWAFDIFFIEVRCCISGSGLSLADGPPPQRVRERKTNSCESGPDADELGGRAVNSYTRAAKPVARRPAGSPWVAKKKQIVRPEGARHAAAALKLVGISCFEPTGQLTAVENQN
jgi:hypothetical protein